MSSGEGRNPFLGGQIPRKKRPVESESIMDNSNSHQSLSQTLNMAPIPRRPSTQRTTSGSGGNHHNSGGGGGKPSYSIPRKSSTEGTRPPGLNSGSTHGKSRFSSVGSNASSNVEHNNEKRRKTFSSGIEGDVDTSNSALYSDTEKRGRKALLSRKAAVVAASAPAPKPATLKSRPSSLRRITQISQEPLVLRILLKNIPLHEGITTVAASTNVANNSSITSNKSTTGLPGSPMAVEDEDFASNKSRISERTPKRQRICYTELEDTDDEDEEAFLQGSSTKLLSDKDNSQDNNIKRLGKKSKTSHNGSSSDLKSMTGVHETDPLSSVQPAMEGVPVVEAAYPGQDVPPPPGTLNTLWYSRECFATLWVLEKLHGWKKRYRVELLSLPNREPYFLDHQLAVQYQLQLLADSNLWYDVRRRMEVSRIQPGQCPMVLALAAASEEMQAKAENREATFCIEASKVRDDEVVLVKWRGRSYWHCSWERLVDLQKFDPNNTARQKIKRYVQLQETTMGLSWKQQLDDERLTALDNAHELSLSVCIDEDYLPAQCLEVERILACDETEITMQVLAKQRRTNMLNDQKAQDKRAEAPEKEYGPLSWVRDLVKTESSLDEESWDPEDNVRYVVKWKGLPYADITWEYWRDIKREAVDEAEDFWNRQKPPAIIPNQPHPHVRDFKKLVESPVYGISSRTRPVLSLDSDNTTNVDEEEDSTFEGFKLRSYQLEGVNWLLFNWWNKRSCILADEMGLGKTIQSAAFLQQLQTNSSTQVRGPFLIVAPLSLVGQWKSELQSWAPDINCVLYHGSADARDFLVQQEFYYTEQFNPKATVTKLKRQHVTKFHVLITTYEVVLKDIAVLSKIRWKVLVVDEAHRLKNPRAKLFDDLASVPREFCVLLTGTPIANATEELWALLHFANPTAFTDKDEFLAKFGEMTGAQQVNDLHSILKPYLLRRVKEDVEKSLPPKEETILEVSLTPIQKAFYKAIYERNTSFLYKGSKPSNAPSLNNVMMELRKCCNHPYLIKGAEERILTDAAAKIKSQSEAEGKEVVIDHLKLFGEQLVKSSGKMVLVEKLLQKLFDGGHKVLVFSQMVRVLNLLEELLKLKRYKYERLDGSTKSSSRVAAVDRFCRKSCHRFVMLLSTRAGGLGLNLTSADTVIIFDSDWNPQNDLQAMARAHRIGQTRAVNVYRLLTAKTYEMHMFHSASLKLGLERAVLSQNREQNDGNDDNSKSKKASDREAQAKEIDELLKKGAYDVFRDEDDTEAEKFMETDIDQLLEKSSKKVIYGASSSSGNGLGSFSKASFVTDTGEGEKDVDLDDPEFWSKAVGLEAPDEVPEELAAMIDDGIKRSRKQVQVYDPYADHALNEQRRKDKLAMEKLLEKEEKERERTEKLRKKKAAKEKRRREREEQVLQSVVDKASTKTIPGTAISETATVTVNEPLKVDSSQRNDEIKSELHPVSIDAKAKVKRRKKNQKLVVARRAENTDPPFERIKQAWDIPQCTRVASSILRFGFGRFAKIRAESNMNSLPLQDLEVFYRSYVYQAALQVSVTILRLLQENQGIVKLRDLFKSWIGHNSSIELDWLCDTLYSVMNMQHDIEAKRRSLRMPTVLADPAFVEDLRRGAGLRVLRRVGTLARLNLVVESCIDSILSSLGRQELGKRGCGIGDTSELDLDLKGRHITREELCVALGVRCRRIKEQSPATWWNKHCDMALLVGSYIHGFGNYHAMQYDPDLPFLDMSKQSAKASKAAQHASNLYNVATSAAREVFYKALEAARTKAELEIQAAVAAAAKAATKREEDALLLRKGGAEAAAVISSMPDTQVDDAFKYDGTDSHFVTLHRLMKSIQGVVFAGYNNANMTLDDANSELITERSDLGDIASNKDQISADKARSTSSARIQFDTNLPMPDSRVLDCRLLAILNSIEREIHHLNTDEAKRDAWVRSPTVETNNEALRKCLFLYFGEVLSKSLQNEFSGVGMSSYQCAALHRTLNDGSSYFYGSASSSLAVVSYGADSVRYLRALGVPMNLTRFAVVGLAYATETWLDRMLMIETERYKKQTSSQKAVTADSQAADTNLTASKSTDTVKDESGENPGIIINEPVGVQGEATAEANTSVEEQLLEETFSANCSLRAAVCVTLLFSGAPHLSSPPLTLCPKLADILSSEDGESDRDTKLLDMSTFHRMVQEIYTGENIPDPQAISTYVEDMLLPHCLKLCLYGNGDMIQNARGSQGEYETALGVSICAEPSRTQPSAIPDPYLMPKDHSIEAIGYACAILRRTRLLRACQTVCCSPELSSILIERSNCAAENPDSVGVKVPLWWDPKLHDVALITAAAQSGLFTVLKDRKQHSIFAIDKVQTKLVTSVASNEHLPQILSSLHPIGLSDWSKPFINKFLTANQLERRVAYFCSVATENLDVSKKFVCLPMFDHGGWPRD